MERELQALFADTYRRIWVTYSRLDTVQVTLFPIDPNQTYRIITEQKFGEITIEKLRDLIMRNP